MTIYYGTTRNDTYIVNSTVDRIIEKLNEGTDAVRASVRFTLGANVENLVLTGSSAINGYGNSLNNLITGNTANNTLDGGDGNDNLNGGLGNDTIVGGAGNDYLNGAEGDDSMSGGIGNDSYIVDSTLDKIRENLDEGTDTVRSSVNFTLGDNLEYLVLTGSSATDGYGNSLNNLITGNTANNYIDGRDGNDNLNGGLGNDTLLGGDGNDYLNGAEGNDSMSGGIGNDSYFVNSGLDSITESPDEGTDTVRASISFRLAANLENLVLTGSRAINGNGNSLNNLITGNSANNTLEGRDGNDNLNGGLGNDTIVGGAGNDYLNGAEGNDSMSGGIGNDTYFVDSSSDRITEILDEGTDTVRASISFTLDANLENLVVTGSSTINGYGNSFNNRITGNTANNYLDGRDGNDNLTGGDGNDTLVGGGGSDLIVGDLGLDLLTGGAGSDKFFLKEQQGVNNSTSGDWIADFQDGQDVLLLDGNLTFGQLTITSLYGDTAGVPAWTNIIVSSTGESLALLVNIQPRQITAADFMTI